MQQREQKTYIQICKDICQTFGHYIVLYGTPLFLGYGTTLGVEAAVAGWNNRPFNFEEASVAGAVVAGGLELFSIFARKVAGGTNRTLQIQDNPYTSLPQDAKIPFLSAPTQ